MNNLLSSERYYFQRTFDHIKRVQKSALYLILNHTEDLGLDVEDCRQLFKNVLHHDSSKFQMQQFRAYIDFSWCKKTNTDLTDGQQYNFDKAWKNHYTVENHHPERFVEDCGQMSKIEIIEMACDLQAMAEELEEGNFLNYFNDVWRERQSKNFSDDFDWEQTKNLMIQIGNIFKSANIPPEELTNEDEGKTVRGEYSMIKRLCGSLEMVMKKIFE